MNVENATEIHFTSRVHVRSPATLTTNQTSAIRIEVKVVSLQVWKVRNI